MSLAPTRPDTGTLLAFLREGGHIIEPSLLLGICDRLPSDDKLAAKELRGHLRGLGAELKHTHALKAIAQLRGGRAHLGDDGTRWEVASWVADAPAVSARVRRARSLAKAADLLMERLRDQLEESPPTLVRLHGGTDLELAIPETGWSALVARSGSAGEPIAVTLKERGQFAERVRRLVEGEFGGWFDGALYAGLSFAPRYAVRGAGGGDALSEWEFVGRVATELSDAESTVEAAQKVLDLLSPYVRGLQPAARPPTAEEMERLVRRLRGFESRAQVRFAEWIAAAVELPSQYAPQPLNLAAVQAQMKRLGLAEDAVASAMSISADALGGFLKAGEMPLAHFAGLVQALKLESCDVILGRTADPLPNIPLREPEAAGLFLSRFEHLALEESVALQLPAAAQVLLQRLAALPFEARRRCDKGEQPDLEAVFQAVRGADSVLSVRMETRFVRDLPRGRERLAIAMVLGAHPRRVVDQFAPATEEERVPFDDDVDEEWLARFNRQEFMGDDLLRYSDMVNELRGPDDDGKGHFETQVFAGVRTFHRNADRAHAAQVRMEALASLMTKVNLQPWVVKSTDEGAQMLSRPVFEATAKCPLVARHGRPAFDPESFQRLVVAHVEVD